MDMTIDDARALVSDADLWPRIRNFLWDFAPQVHPSWLESRETENSQPSNDQTPEPSAPQTHEPSNHQTIKPSNHQTIELSCYQPVKRLILDSLNVEPCFHTFPEDDWSRLLLLDGSTLEMLVKWLGALVCADDLRKLTSGAKVRELKAALPGIYPDVFNYTAYFRELKSWKIEKLESREVEQSDVRCRMSNVESPETIICIGWYMVQSIVANVPKPLLYRLTLKLPKDYSNLQLSNFPAFQLSDFPALGKSIKLLLKLRFPEAYSLCC